MLFSVKHPVRALNILLLLLPLCASPLMISAQPVEVSRDRVTLAMPDLDHTTSVWLPGCQGYPMPRLDVTKVCQTHPQEVEVVGLENEFFKVRFVPVLGARILDVVWKSDGTSPLFQQTPTMFDPVYRDEGLGYMVHGGSAKWGFPFFGHTFSDHASWSYEVTKTPAGDATFHGWWTDSCSTGLRLDVRVTVHPGVAALDVAFAISNPTASAQAYDFWADIYVPSSTFTELMLPTDQVITHQDASMRLRNMVVPWPMLEDADLRYCRSWRESNGYFPLKPRESYSGFYCHDRQQGVLRVFDEGKDIGTKFWMPSVSAAADLGEMFSGSNPTHDERSELAPAAVRSWTERWLLCRDLRGMDGGTRDLALHLEVDSNQACIYLTSAARMPHVEVQLEMISDHGVRVTTVGQWHGDLHPGTASCAPFPPLLAGIEDVVCRIRYGTNEYVWATPASLLKQPFSDPRLDAVRATYTARCKPTGTSNGVTHAASTNTPAEDIPVKPAYRQVGKLGVDGAQRLYRPSAGVVLPDGTRVVADANNLLLFDAQFKYLGKWEGTNAMFCPLGLALDSAGRLLVADTGNKRVVRMVCAAGQGASAWRVDAVWQVGGRCADLAWNKGRIVYSLPTDGCVMAFSDAEPSGDVHSQQVATGLHAPFGVCFDHDDVIIADTLQSRVVSVQTNGTIRELATASAGLYKPSRVCMFQGRLLVSDAGRACLFEVQGGQARTVVDGTLMGKVSLAIPGALAAAGDHLFMTVADPAQLLLFDQDWNVSQRYDFNNNGGQTSYRPRSVAVLPDGRMVTVNDSLGRLRVFDANGKQTAVAGSWGHEEGQLWGPSVVRCDTNGNLYIADLFNYRILRFDPQGVMRRPLELQTADTEAVVKAPYWYVHGMSIGPDDKLYVADHAHGSIRVYSAAPENRLLEVISLGEDFYPVGIDVDAKGRILAANSFRSEIAFYNPGRKDQPLERRLLGASFLLPLCVAWDKDGGYFLAGDGLCWEPERSVWHFGAQHGCEHSFVYSDLPDPSDLVFRGEELLVASRKNDSRCVYAVARDHTIRRVLKYPAWPVLQGEPNAVRAIFFLHDGTLVVPQGNTSTLDFYRPDFSFIRQTNMPPQGAKWATLCDDEMTLYNPDRPCQYVMTRDGALTKLGFKGVNKIYDAFHLVGDVWFAYTDKGSKFFHGTGDDAVMADAPSWAQDRDIWSAVHMPDGTMWLSRRIRRSTTDFVHLDHDLNVIQTSPGYNNLTPVCIIRVPDGFLVVNAEDGIIHFDVDMRNPATVLDVPAIAADRLPDGRLVVALASKGASCPILVYEPVAK